MKEWPREIRRGFCQLRRLATDWFNGNHQRMISSQQASKVDDRSYPSRLSLEQRIPKTDYVEAKIHNVRMAARLFENLPIPPRHIFSFWHLVGRPLQTRGFRPGRSLLGGKLVADFGGGLCQLSGILYYLSLQAGLEILERHEHSLDIYDDQDRYAPLAADAAVAYGFKDLRVLNSSGSPICFRISVNEDMITASICSPDLIEPCRVDFVKIAEVDGTCTVETRRQHTLDDDYRVESVSRYRRITRHDPRRR